MTLSTTYLGNYSTVVYQGHAEFLVSTVVWVLYLPCELLHSAIPRLDRSLLARVGNVLGFRVWGFRVQGSGFRV